MAKGPEQLNAATQTMQDLVLAFVYCFTALILFKNLAWFYPSVLRVFKMQASSPRVVIKLDEPFQLIQLSVHLRAKRLPVQLWSCLVFSLHGIQVLQTGAAEPSDA